MCGIAGILRFAGRPEVGAGDAAGMVAALAHRGPDGEGTFVGDGVVLGNRRLAIIDRSGGGQPMVDGGRALTLNGEIYDHEEQRARLRAAGAEFTSRSDTEVLLRILEREGTAGLAGLSGMFGLAYLEAGRLTLARDRYGIKPLLYEHDGDGIRFASELPALLAGRAGTPRLDLDALVERLAFQVPLSPRTLVRGVLSLPPGEALVADRCGEVSIERYAPGPREPGEGRTEVEWAEALRAEIERATALATRSDAPLGVALSGGLDSALVAGAAARAAGTGIPAFTGWFAEGPAFDERPHARRAAEEIGLPLVEVPITPEDLTKNLRRLAVALEGPIAGPGSLPELIVARRAAEQVKVILNGQGADEVFGGYARHRIAVLESEGRLDPDHLPPDIATYGPLVRHLRAADAGGSFADVFFRLVHRGDGLLPLLGPAVADAFRAFDARAAFGQVFEKEPGGPFRRMVAFERRTLLPALLHVEDRVSMAASIESRPPLLSPGVVECAERIPPEIAFGDAEPKRILRLAAEGLAPPSAVRRRDKMGFPVPLGEWARGPLRDEFLAILRDGPLVPAGILAPDAPQELIDGAGGHGRHLWFFLILSEWMAATGVSP